MKVWRENCSNWWTYFKKSLVAIFHMLTRFLPEGVQTFTEPFFSKLLSSYDATVELGKGMEESTTDFSDVSSPTEKD